MEEVAREHNVPLVDVVQAFKAADHYLFVDPEVDPIHPNPEGHAIIAQRIMATLSSNGIARPARE